jgi:hypothetical protein
VKLRRKVTQRVHIKVESPNNRLVLSGGSGECPVRALVGICIERPSKRIKANPNMDAVSI